jgi:RNA polymerase subunit RPABC4/transcription elongation factor Spt4
MVFFFLTYAVVFAFLCGNLAQNKGYGFGSYATLGFFLGIFGLLYVGFLRDSRTAVRETEGRRRCPDCAELILADAVKCRFCGRAVEKGEPIYVARQADPGKKFCRKCGKQVNARAKGCAYCNARF